MRETKGWLQGPSARVRLVAIMAIALQAFLPMFQAEDAGAQITAPTLDDGTSLSPSEAPCVPYTIGRSTGTTATTVRATGPGYISWIFTSTAPATAASYVTLLDTSALSAGPSAALIVPRVYLTSTTANTLVTFRPPVRFANGVNAALSDAADVVTICTRVYGTQVP